MTDKELILKGYKEYPCEYKQYAEKLFQKRFVDSIGIKYFIDVYKYPEITDYRTGKRIDASYEYEVHLHTNDEKERNVNIQYYSDWDIEDVEKNIEEIFATGKWAYYEKD